MQQVRKVIAPALVLGIGAFAIMAALAILNLPTQAEADSGMGLSARANDNHVYLEWNSAGDDVDGYFVLRRSEGQTRWRTAGIVTGGFTTYLDADVGSVTTHTYRVLPFDEADDIVPTPISSLSNLLPAPTNLRLEPVLNNAGTSITGVQLSFDNNPLSHQGLVDMYAVYKNGQLINDAAYITPSVVDGRRVWVDESAETPGETFSYQVRYKAGRSFEYDTYISDLTNPVEITLPNMAPENLTATVGSEGVVLEWSPSGLTKQPLTGHRIFRKGPSDTIMQVHVVDTGESAATYVDRNVQGGTEYIYRVSELVGEFSGYRSNRVVVNTPAVPAVPGQPEIHLHDGATIIRWDDVADAGHYLVSRRDAGDGNSWNLVSGQVEGLVFRDATIALGAAYQYAVQSASSFVNSELSPVASITIPQLPPRLDNLAGSLSAEKIHLNWTQPDDLEQSEGFEGFRVIRSVYADSSMTALEESTVINRSGAQVSAVLGILDTDIRPGHHNVYTISAVNVMGAGEASIPWSVSLPNAPPRPANLRSAVEQGNVVLTWDDPGDSEITGYRIFRRVPSLGEKKLVTYLSDTLDTNPTFSDRGVHAGSAHVYRVAAVRGVVVGEWSSFTRITP